MTADSNTDYKKAYLRQKKARELAENLLEHRSSELYETHKSLAMAYEKLKDQKSHLFHQEKLASIGQLSAGVAHEINNPAGFVKSNISSLKRYLVNIQAAFVAYEAHLLEAGIEQSAIETLKKEFDLQYILDDIEELVDDSIEGLSRIENIVKSLKNFARPDSNEPELFDVNDCIETTIKLIAKEITLKGGLVKTLKSTKLVSGQPGNISQVILNLLVNATQAIEQYGNIHILTQDRNSEVIITVSDDGCGIDPGNLKKIFDPFFTTKNIGVGTGLGLSVSHGIIKKHNGELSVTSQPGKGSTFSITLPTAH